MSDDIAVGDLASDEVGSGARKNAGKLPMDFIPVSHWVEAWFTGREDTPVHLYSALRFLADWQEGKDEDGVWGALLILYRDWEESVRVFEFGARKYATWNWAKGMAWSIPVGCILRHAKAILGGEEIDQDSGLRHMGHIVCNLHMLAWYQDHYPEGDDRPIFRRSESPRETRYAFQQPGYEPPEIKALGIHNDSLEGV